VVSPYKFYEFCDDSPSASKFNVIPDPGCYRVEKVKRKTGLCHQGYDDALVKLVVEPYPEFIKNNCIAVEKIEKPEAPAKFAIKEDIFDKSKDTFFMRFEFIMEDYNDVLSRQVDYTYYTSHGRLPSYSCHHVIDGFKRYSIDEFAQKTINPNN
jgi:hypothetical protein